MSFIATTLRRTSPLHKNITCRFVIPPARTYASRLPQRPSPKVPDPLLNNPRATYSPLPSSSSPTSGDLTFIHRTPPSLPPPESLTTSPASPLLRPPSAPGPVSWTDPALPPVSRPALLDPAGPRARMSDGDIEQMKALRARNPAKWSRSKLAARFGCTETFVSLVAGLKKSEWKKKVRGMAGEHERVRNLWGERKSMIRKVRTRRREFW